MLFSDLSSRATQVARKRSFWLYAGLFVLAYGLFLVVLLPAAYLAPTSKTGANDLQTGQVQGTVWRGGVGWVKWRYLTASQIEWDFNPWAWFGGKWEYRVDFKLDNMPVTGYIANTLSGAWRIRDLVADLQLQNMPHITNNLSNQLPGKLQGDLAIQLDNMRLAGQWPESVQGDLVVQNLRVGDLPGLGDWEGTVDKEGDNLIVVFAPRGKVLRGQGRFTLSPDHQWTFALQIKPGEAADQELMSWLSLLGAPDAEGYRRMQQSGRLR